MAEREFRFCELRADASKRTLEGTLIRFDDTARIAGVFNERVQSGAFSYEDVLLNLQHQRHIPLARSGPNLRISEDCQSLQLVATLANTAAANDALALVEAGVLRGFSSEFVVREDQWSNGGEDRLIIRATLYGVGVVDTPAYPKSTIDARAAYIDTIKAPDRLTWMV